MTGIQMVHVPYKGAILALTDVIGGHVDSMFVAAPSAIPQVKGGKVRALAVASKRRAPALPDLPTFAEAGFPGVEVDSRYGILAPAAVPREAITRLNAAIATTLGTTEVRERYISLGLEAAGSTPQELREWVRSELARWTKAVNDAGIRVQGK